MLKEGEKSEKRRVSFETQRDATSRDKKERHCNSLSCQLVTKHVLFPDDIGSLKGSRSDLRGEYEKGQHRFSDEEQEKTQDEARDETDDVVGGLQTLASEVLDKSLRVIRGTCREKRSARVCERTTTRRIFFPHHRRSLSPRS